MSIFDNWVDGCHDGDYAGCYDGDYAGCISGYMALYWWKYMRIFG